MRRALLIAALVVLAACGDDAAPPPPPRFEAVRRHAGGPDLSAFCDVRKDAADAAPFAWPATTTPLAARTPGRWTWVNLWATWCHPCVDELARITSWRDRLATEGAPADLVLLSVDSADADVAGFVAQHRDAHGTLRLASADALPALVASLGLPEGTGIPIHAFLDPAGKLRCVRSGAVNDDDYDAVRAVLSQH